MDGQLRNPKKWIIAAEENVVGGAIGGANSDPTGQTEVTIEPRIEQDAAVDLDAELSHPRRLMVGARSETEIGRISVGADDPKAAAGVSFARGRPGNEGTASPQNVSTGLRGPGRRFVNKGEAFRNKAIGGLRHGVEGRWRGRYVGGEVIEV